MANETLYTKVAKMTKKANENDGQVPLAEALALIEAAAIEDQVSSKEFRSKSMFAALCLK